MNDTNNINNLNLKARLTNIQYHVTQESGTEPPFTGIYWDEKRNGDYFCICCGHLLFTSKMKYDSRCGWPSFHHEEPGAGIKRLPDLSGGIVRVEVRCGSCDAHLGHVFEDGPKDEGGERYCINSASIQFGVDV
jgi:peptide-methionine (R)-S-oxide reductase|tara:strand:+ start:326 stop:727 length:402 start_codon:yes stop_codon:yes gene_type:complete